ncbi:protease [Deltaproteobacteria bacterium Smac51]|nr:protease [Deltaproteobacteria bacterium Smac51]
MKTIAILLEEMHNEHELWYPYWRLKEAGFEPVFADTGRLKSYRGEKGHLEAKPDKSVKEIKADELLGLIVPGGFGPDFLRRDEAVIKLVCEVDKGGKPLGAICHAGWLLITADILRGGRKITGYKTLQVDLTNAGGQWVDAEVVVDGNLLSCRQPEDLPAFMPAYIEHLKKAAAK